MKKKNNIKLTWANSCALNNVIFFRGFASKYPRKPANKEINKTVSL